MKWNIWSKWPLLGVAATAVALAAPSDEGLEGAQTAAANPPQQIASAPPQSDSRLTPAAAHGKQMFPEGRQTGRVELERLKRARPEAAAEQSDVANAFNPVSWYQPPPPPPPPTPQQAVPESAPVAPPLPFSYFGRYEDTTSRIVILTKGEQLYTISEGDVIDDIYRVERIANEAVALIYLPLGTSQSISMGAQ